MRNVFVTGSAGFVGFQIALASLERGEKVVGIDNFNSYYDVKLKEQRSKILSGFAHYSEIRASIETEGVLSNILSKNKFDVVFHMAAQAGVRYSLEAPFLYTQSNIDGSLRLFEALRLYQPNTPCVAASSSSVYGRSKKMPFTESDAVDSPSSLYAATKRGMELIASSYAHLFGLRVACLRFFTVYGPWGRPDMALFSFVKSILNREKIELFNNGEMLRDFTFISDVVEACFAVDSYLSQSNSLKSASEGHFDVFNVGYGSPVHLKDFVFSIERALGVKADIEFKPFQPGDVHSTHADTSKLRAATGWSPRVSLDEGVARFVEWYRANA